MRYTLDTSKSQIHSGVELFSVLDNGKPTEAYAKEGVVFSDRCTITGGLFHNGWFRGGEFRGGEFHNGLFHGGEFHGGIFYDGEFNGGIFHDGVFHGGEFHDGTFHDGTFRGGEFRCGWLPLQIQGSKHFVNIPDGVSIAIGCRTHVVDYWLQHFEDIGKIEGYTTAQISEYKMYIDLAAKIIAKEKA